MLDLSLCRSQECFHFGDPDERTEFFFEYPEPYGTVEFFHDDNYGNVVSMCLMVTEDPVGHVSVEISPTVYMPSEDAFIDVDWFTLDEGVDYNLDDILKLIFDFEGKRGGKR